MEKVLAINANTGIDRRSTACDIRHPILDGERAPTIDELSSFYLQEGVKLAVGASRKAIEEWGGDVSQITHVVASTCTNSANPGYDFFVARELGLSGTVDRTLLHGVGCAGGLAALRTAANLALGASFMKRPARILVVACELASLMCRSELDSIAETQELRIGVTIFADGASALILSNGIGESPETKAVFDLLAWDHRTIPETDKDIGFDVHPNGTCLTPIYRTLITDCQELLSLVSGWKVILSPRVPALASTSVPPLFNSLLPRVPSLADKGLAAGDLDWALHPGGLKVLTSVQKLMGLSAHQLRASYDVYKHHGNTSGATIFSVLNTLRSAKMGPGKEHVVACAFGPGVAVEMCVLRRRDAGVESVVPADSASSSDSD